MSTLEKRLAALYSYRLCLHAQLAEVQKAIGAEQEKERESVAKQSEQERALAAQHQRHMEAFFLHCDGFILDEIGDRLGGVCRERAHQLTRKGRQLVMGTTRKEANDPAGFEDAHALLVDGRGRQIGVDTLIKARDRARALLHQWQP